MADASWKRNGLYILDAPADAASLAALPEARRLSPEGLNIGADSGVGLSSSYLRAPDSQGLVAIATPTPKADDGFHPDVVTFDLSGEMQTLGNYEGLWSRPIYSPDGSTIGFIACEDGAPWPTSRSAPSPPRAVRLRRCCRATRAPSTTSPGCPTATACWRWSRRARAIACASSTRKTTPPSWPATRPAGPATAAASSASRPASADGKRLAFVWGDATTHADAWVADVNGEAKQLTDLNPWIRDYTFGEVRE